MQYGTIILQKTAKQHFRCGNIVADYFVQKQRSGDYKPEEKKMQHVQEVLQLLRVMTGDHRFEEVCEDNSEGGPKTMCEVLDRIEKIGIAEGMAEGVAKGENTILVLMQKLFAAGKVEDAQKASNDRAYCARLLAEFGLA